MTIRAKLGAIKPSRFDRWATAFVAALSIVVCATGARAEDSDMLRPYFYAGAGGALFTSADQGAGLELENPSQFPFPQVALGVNLNRYVGVELAVNYTETNLDLTGTGKLGEYSFWTIAPQVRLRYPLLRDKLVPYAVLGAGVGIGEFNDRSILNANIQFGGSQDTSFVGVAGLGVEYFLMRNMALGIEAKHIFGAQTDVTFGGQKREFDLDNTMVLAGLRLFFDGDTAPDGSPLPPPADSDKLRGYFSLRAGGVFFTSPDGSFGIERDNPVKVDFGASLGMNFNKHWGLELAWDFFEPALSVPGIGEVSELTLWTTLIQGRYRYPIMNDRVVPYVLAGAGVGVGQLNDRRVLTSVYPLTGGDSVSPIGVVGGGIEYFLVDNIALGVEARYMFGYSQDIKVGGVSGELTNDNVQLAVSLRVLFP